LVGLYPSFKHLVLLNNENRPIARAARTSIAASDQFIAQLNGSLLEEINQPGRFIGSVLIDPLTSEPQVILSMLSTKADLQTALNNYRKN
jgi:hypothetical protein